MTEKRAAIRVRPIKTITMAVAQGARPPWHGIVEDISEGGARVVSDAAPPAGQWVGVALSFPREPQVFEARARLVWLSRGTGNLLSWGVQFSPVPELRRAQLLSLIGRAGALAR